MAGSNGRAKRHFFGGTGLYIALFLGVTALAVAGYWTLLPKNTTDKDAENVSSQVELRDDDMMGTLVTIAHDDGYETTYANLRSSPGVGEGQYVSAGEVIGAVGSSSIAEFSMPAHLHFSVSKDGVPCDPAEFLN